MTSGREKMKSLPYNEIIKTEIMKEIEGKLKGE
jgi:hypothetical protein